MKMTTEQRPLVSIVANFYNSARFIPKLIKSVLAQTYDNWELIAVNDCSPGRDREVLEKWAAKPEARGRIRIINNTVNQGITEAKHTGIMAAQGEYITFSDGDDWLAPDAIEQMLRPMMEHKLDLVYANNMRVFPPVWLHTRLNYRPMCSPVEYNKVIGRDDMTERYYIGFFGINVFCSYAYWAKMYRTELARSIQMPELINVAYEDIIFNMEYFERAQRMMCIPAKVYFWRWGGITSSNSKRTVTDYQTRGILKQFNLLYDLRLDKIKRFNYEKALVPLRIEMKNVLVNALYKFAAYDASDSRSQAVKDMLEWSYTLPNYMSANQIPQSSVKRHLKFMQAYVAHDTESAYAYLHNYWKSKKRERTKRRLAALFT